MKRTVKRNGYVIEYEDTTKYSQKEIDSMIDDSIKILQRAEDKEVQDEAYLVHSDGRKVKEGDEVTDFRGEKAIVTGWELPRYEGKSGRVYVKEKNAKGEEWEMGYYPQVYNLSWVGLPWQKKEEVKDFREPIDTFKEFKYMDKTRQGLEIVKAYEDLKDHRMHVIVHRPFDNTYIVGLGYSPDDGVWNQGRYDFPSFEKAKAALDKEYSVKEYVKDIKVEDVPYNAPEENVSITYTEKLKGGKNALTYGMIEQAFKDRDKDGGKTFTAYVDVALENLKEDIKDAKYLVSGEVKSIRNLLLEDYVKIEHLIQKAGMTDKLAEFKPLVDELSEKLNLNYFKQPKFKKEQMKQASRELRNKHRWDSTIVKSVEPVFLCSKTDLTASYNDAKNGKLPQVFEGNLAKVEKDMEADFDRIMQGRDNYMEDPRIIKVLPKIVDLYQTATNYADDLGYDDIANRFANMLTTIKKGWALE